jgi:hypothetical protein
MSSRAGRGNQYDGLSSGNPSKVKKLSHKNEIVTKTFGDVKNKHLKLKNYR